MLKQKFYILSTLIFIASHISSMHYIPEDLLEASKYGREKSRLDSDLALMNAIILQNPKFLNVVDKHGRTPLHLSILWQYPEKVRLLVNAGANLEARDAKGRTPLFYAVKHRGMDLEIAQFLLDAGAYINAQDKKGKTVFMIALTDDYPLDTAKFFISSENELLRYYKLLALLEHYGADLALTDCKGTSSYNLIEALDCYNIRDAVLNNNIELLNILQQKGIDFNSIDNDKTLLMHFSFNDSCNENSSNIPEIFNMLIKSGANLEQQNNEQQTALHLAVLAGKVNKVRLLLAAGANVHALDKYGRTPIFYAVKPLSMPIFTLLLHNKALVNVKDNDGKTLIEFAQNEQSPTALKAIIRRMNTEERQNYFALLKILKKAEEQSTIDAEEKTCAL